MKEFLSSATESKFSLECLAQSKDLEFTISRDKFEQICDSVFKRLIDPI